MLSLWTVELSPAEYSPKTRRKHTGGVLREEFPCHLGFYVAVLRIVQAQNSGIFRTDGIGKIVVQYPESLFPIA